MDGSEALRIEEPPAALIAFLDATRAPLSWSSACDALVAAGAESAEAPELLAGFIDDALLTPSAD